MNLNLDLSKLSPMNRDKVVDAIYEILMEQSNRINFDASHYFEGGAIKKEMIDWANAAKDVAIDARNQQKGW
jgi:hypothetical protein